MSSRSLPMRARPLSARDAPTGAAIEREQPARHAPDYPLLTAVAMLLIIGLVTVYSASFALGFVQFGDANYFVKRQAVGAVVSGSNAFREFNLNQMYCDTPRGEPQGPPGLAFTRKIRRQV